MEYHNKQHHTDSLRIEIVTACVGFDDFLELSLRENAAQVDTMIVVTSHDDKKTQLVAKKYGAICVQTDLFRKNERSFNKGAALNAGMGHFQYRGWRLHIDADIVLPNNFRRFLFNHTHLDTSCIYGADRSNLIGIEAYNEFCSLNHHLYGFFVNMPNHVCHRYVDQLRGYVPIGYFQLWHALCDKAYPWSLGTAAHDDVLFAEQWPSAQRRLLPSFVVGHLCSSVPEVGENWDGNRKQARITL